MLTEIQLFWLRTFAQIVSYYMCYMCVQCLKAYLSIWKSKASFDVFGRSVLYSYTPTILMICNSFHKCDSDPDITYPKYLLPKEEHADH